MTRYVVTPDGVVSPRERRARPYRSLALVVALCVLVGLGVGLLRDGRQAAVAPAAAATGVVDVDTRLGYQDVSAAGTGIVLTSSGLVLTNDHVVRGATEVTVTVPSSGRSYAATVLGYSPGEDVAVLQLRGASGLRTASIGSSAGVRVGDAVSAAGNAGGLGGAPTVVTGTVTGLGRSITVSDDQGDIESLTGLIETDADLRPGDSGGPLLDASNRVVGIDTAATTGFRFDTGARAGYAIPIDRALELERQIVSGRSSAGVHVGPTAFLGVQTQADDYAAGAVVAGVVSGSPAESAGIGDGDTIVAVGGHAVDSPTALARVMLGERAGAVVTLEWVDRFGSRSTASVRLASGPPR